MSQQPSQDQIVKISESIPLSTSNIIAPQNIDEAKKSFKKSSSTNKFLAVVLKCCMAINPFKPKMNLLGPKPEEYAKRKTLVLDIDETLVHTTLGKKDNSDIYLGSSDGLEDMGVVKRPFVDEFLEKVGQMFEVVIFTAGISIYGKAIVSKLDQTKTVYKTLSREHCTYMNGVYVKNLARLGRDLKDIILVDNSANSFLMQPDNAYHIPSFFDDKADRELQKLLPFLEYLAKVDDVRPVRGLFQKYESGGICRENQLLKTVEQTADNIDAKAQNDSESNKTGNGQEIPITEPQSLYIAGKGVSRESVHSGPETHNFHQKDMEADMLEDMEVAPKELNPLIHKKSRQKTAFVARSSHQENAADFKKHRSLAKLDTERSALKEEEEEDNGKEIKNLEVEDLEGVDQRYKYYPRGDANSPVLGLGGILESNETRSSLFQVRAL